MQGSGPTLLVVHPGGQDTSTWDHVATLLQSDFQVVRIRRRIYDLRRMPPPEHSMKSEAADIVAVADAILGAVVAVGHSSGAVGALEAAVQAPARFDGVIAYEPPMPVDTLVAGKAQARACAALEAGDPVEAMRIHLQNIVGIPSSAVGEMINDGPTRAALTTFAGAQLADNAAIDGLGGGIARYAGLPIPVVLLIGQLTARHLRERSEALAKVIPHVRTITMEGTGHLAHLDAPQLLADTVRSAAQAMLDR